MEHCQHKTTAALSSMLYGILVILLSLAVTASLLPGCATPSKGTILQAARETEQKSLEEKWGVRIESLRLSAAGNLLDFRYRIIDADKALPLVDRRNKPYLIDEASGASLAVPNTAKVGPLRQTVKYGKPKEDRIYCIMFGNPGKFVKQGNKVAVVIGDFRVENLVVE
jgi:hypothetical protein